MKMSPATRMMVMSDRYKKSGNGERQHDGRHQMEQPRYNEDYVGRKDWERQGIEYRRQPEEVDEEEYWRKPQRMYAAGMAWTDEGQGKKHGWKEYDEHREHEEPKEVDEECAMKWVRHMKNVDGSTAPHFKPDLAEQMRMAYCPECKKWEWFVAINMMYADYGNVAKKMGVDRDEYYAHMAKAFLMDEDAGQHKLAKYMEVIPKK